MLDKHSKGILISIGNNVRRLRQEKGLTQEQLANNCDMELSQINRIELGKINPRIITLCKIVDTLKIEIKDLFND